MLTRLCKVSQHMIAAEAKARRVEPGFTLTSLTDESCRINTPRVVTKPMSGGSQPIYAAEKAI